MNADTGAYAGILMVAVLLGLVLLVLWIVLPFAVFDLKSKTRDLLQEQRTTNILLRNIDKSLAEMTQSSPPGRSMFDAPLRKPPQTGNNPK